MKRISVVVSGFGPYPDLSVNPAGEVPSALARRGLPPQLDDVADLPGDVEVTITDVQLPISFAKAWPMLRARLEDIHPNIVIATGVKHASRGISLERCATNLVDSARPDAENTSPRRGPIDPSGPAAYWTKLPLRSILKSFAADDIPATLSSDAGTYVCNSLFYDLLNWTASQQRVLAGFVSFPVVSESNSQHNGLALDQQITAGAHVVAQSLRYVLRPPSDDILLG